MPQLEAVNALFNCGVGQEYAKDTVAKASVPPTVIAHDPVAFLSSIWWTIDLRNLDVVIDKAQLERALSLLHFRDDAIPRLGILAVKRRLILCLGRRDTVEWAMMLSEGFKIRAEGEA